MKYKYSTKYGNVKQIFDGKVFDSKKELGRYKELVLLQAAGEITDLSIHPKYLLQATFRDRGGRAVRSITVTWDFFYREKGQEVVEDVKSPITRKETAYNMRKKMFVKRYPDVEFREVL